MTKFQGEEFARGHNLSCASGQPRLATFSYYYYLCNEFYTTSTFVILFDDFSKVVSKKENLELIVANLIETIALMFSASLVLYLAKFLL